MDDYSCVSDILYKGKVIPGAVVSKVESIGTTFKSGITLSSLVKSPSKTSSVAVMVDPVGSPEIASWKVWSKDTSDMEGMEQLKFTLVLSAIW